jgi:4-carboxymuconolactone decarboxylase
MRGKKTSIPRLPALAEKDFSPAQRALIEAIRTGPRGKATAGQDFNRGPFATFLHAPAFGGHAQKLGAHCRYHSGLPPRLSEFAILVTARLWRAQFEWAAHVGIAERAGVKPATIRDLRAGRRPRAAPRDERAIYDFIKELYAKKRIDDRSYARVKAVLGGNPAMVELVGILGYYALVAMMLNVFRMPQPAGEQPAFAEPKAPRKRPA